MPSSNELVISSAQNGHRIALLQDKKLVEYQVEKVDNKFNVGDVFLGNIKKVSQGLNACFVDIGHERDAFLHYLDLGQQFSSLKKFVRQVRSNPQAKVNLLKDFPLEKDIDKLGKISQILTRNTLIPVQIVKEPISSKGSRLTCEISLAGRYLVLVPFSDVISISKKITDKTERQRLQRLINSIRPENFGVIIRTVAEGKEVADLDKDLKSLVRRWEEGVEALKKAKPGDKLIGEVARTSSILRDILNESFDHITTDQKQIYDELKSYIKTIAPDKEKILRLYSGKSKMFEHYGIERQLKALFGRTVSLPSGGYLVIEHTEALHVIDVNSGNKANKEESQENTALSVNLEAAAEVARQLRLRDMGGIIVIDFIDMRKPEHKKLIYNKMKDEMKTDRARFTVLPLSKFGVMQITRQRVRPELNISTTETCPTCHGTGKIAASIVVSDVIESNLEHIITKQNEKDVSIVVHPYLHAYFTKGLFSKRFKWKMKYRTKIHLVEDTTLGVTEFKFLNKKGEAIEVL